MILICFIMIFILFVVSSLTVIINIYLDHKSKSKIKKVQVIKGVIVGRHIDKRLKNICGRDLMICIRSVIKELDDEEICFLVDLMKYQGLIDDIKKVINSRNLENVILYIEMCGELKLVDVEEDIVKCLYRNNKDNKIQYASLLYLSLIGSEKQMMKIFNDENIEILLSHRCMLEIIDNYSGNKMNLYREMLSSNDKYIVRICIKQIGRKSVYEFEDDLIEILKYADNNEIVIDIIRSLGQLKSKKSGNIIKDFCNNNNWIIRNMAYVSLAKIDAMNYKDILMNGLHDEECTVRKNVSYYMKQNSNLAINQTRN